MAEHDPQKPPLPPQQVLSYRRPPAAEPSRDRDGEGLLGCLLTALLIPVGTVLIAGAASATQLPGWVLLSLIGMLFVAPLATGLALRKSHRWGALAVGLLYGLGIAALIEAICVVGPGK
jgi:hypothetical protein